MGRYCAILMILVVIVGSSSAMQNNRIDFSNVFINRFALLSNTELVYNALRLRLTRKQRKQRRERRSLERHEQYWRSLIAQLPTGRVMCHEGQNHLYGWCSSHCTTLYTNNGKKRFK